MRFRVISETVLRFFQLYLRFCSFTNLLVEVFSKFWYNFAIFGNFLCDFVVSNPPLCPGPDERVVRGYFEKHDLIVFNFLWNMILGFTIFIFPDQVAMFYRTGYIVLWTYQFTEQYPKYWTLCKLVELKYNVWSGCEMFLLSLLTVTMLICRVWSL